MLLLQAGGVVAEFLSSLPWYEEYPTSPPTFILNGFIYSVLGRITYTPLLDLAKDWFFFGGYEVFHLWQNAWNIYVYPLPASVTSLNILSFHSVLRSRSRWSRNYLRPGAGAEITGTLKKYLLQSVWRMLGWRKTNFYLHWYGRYYCYRTVLSGNIWQYLDPEPKITNFRYAILLSFISSHA